MQMQFRCRKCCICTRSTLFAYRKFYRKYCKNENVPLKPLNLDIDSSKISGWTSLLVKKGVKVTQFFHCCDPCSLLHNSPESVPTNLKVYQHTPLIFNPMALNLQRTLPYLFGYKAGFSLLLNDYKIRNQYYESLQ